ncbi:unnamed protein product [Symbiodinium necroappetens]|uniref:Uncharacterized protein n=1 Tax=Symbiodinium necroappetens TaxID=1628268 RepID=A0A812V7N4_9DINO|nr:unnamed protein product [Symbiodinium necroappetens]
MTLYVPMRDGLEAGMVGLFADWRDICVPTHLEDATILGVLLDVADILRLRRWSVFDAVRKGERTVVNFDLRDSRRHDGGFRQVPEAFWRSGRQVSAWSQWEWLYQPLQFDIVASRRRDCPFTVQVLWLRIRYANVNGWNSVFLHIPLGVGISAPRRKCQVIRL